MTKVFLTHLLDSLKDAGTLCPGKAAPAVLRHAYLQANSDGLSITTTNLESILSIHLPGDTCTPWAATIPADALKGFKLVSGDIAQLSVDETTKTLIIDGQGKQTSIKTLAGDFPLPPAADNMCDLAHICDIKGLRRALDFVLEATDKNREAYSAVSVEGHGDTLTLTATDGIRIHRAQVQIDKLIAEFTAFIPADALTKLSRLATGTISITIQRLSEKFIRFVWCDSESLRYELATTLREDYPPIYDEAIPNWLPYEVQLAPDAYLTKHVKCCKLFSDTTELHLRRYRDERGASAVEVSLYAESFEIGNVCQVLNQAEHCHDERVIYPHDTIYLSTEALYDAFSRITKAVPNAQITIRYRNPRRAIIFEASGERVKLAAVLMPQAIVEHLRRSFSDLERNEEQAQTRDRALAESEYRQWVKEHLGLAGEVATRDRLYRVTLINNGDIYLRGRPLEVLYEHLYNGAPLY